MLGRFLILWRRCVFVCEVICGDCREVMRGLADSSVDAVVCDPPYELGFMGRKWDAFGDACVSPYGLCE